MTKRKPVTVGDIRDRFDQVDDPDAAERARSDPALAAAMNWLRPRNWHGTGLTPDRILPIAEENGIPIVWVPSAEVIQELAAADPQHRIGVLCSHTDAVLDQCDSLLDRCDDPAIGDARPLAQRALSALRDGHHEAAMALAVNVAEALALWISDRRDFMFESDEQRIGKRSYRLAANRLKRLDSAERRSRFDVEHQALLAPIPQFFVDFSADRGDPIPNTASRHATVHKPTCEHLSLANALLSVMLCTSLIRHQQWMLDEYRD